MLLGVSSGFLPIPLPRHHSHQFATEESADDLQLLSDDLDCDVAPDSKQLHSQLQARQRSLQHGVGKRYIVRTQRGFLNVHYEPSDPFDTSNIVGQLSEGDIVTSTAPHRGNWIAHDRGGWSIARHGGFTWMKEIVE